MKRIIIALVLISFSTGLYAQKGFKVGLQGGLPINEFNDEIGLVLGVDLGYMWGLGKGVDMGIMTNFVNGFPEKFHTNTVANNLPNIQFASIAGSIRFWPSDSFSLGADVGQAFGLSDAYSGGLYYRPILGYLMGANTELNVSYTGIQLDGKDWAVVTLGILCTFKL